MPYEMERPLTVTHQPFLHQSPLVDHQGRNLPWSFLESVAAFTLVNKHLRELATHQVPCRAPRLKSEAAPGPGDGAHHGTGSEMARGQSARVQGEQPSLRLTPAVSQKNSPLDTEPIPPNFVFLPTSQGLCTCFSSPGTPGLSQPQVALYITLCEVPYFLFIGTHMLSTVISFMSFFPYFFPQV